MNSTGSKIRQLLVHMFDDEEFRRCAGSDGALRHFDALEQHALTPDARGYLMELSRRGALPNEQRELIIHYASQLGGEPLDRWDVEELVDHLLFTIPEDDAPRAAFSEHRPH